MRTLIRLAVAALGVATVLGTLNLVGRLANMSMGSAERPHTSPAVTTTTAVTLPLPLTQPPPTPPLNWAGACPQSAGVRALVHVAGSPLVSDAGSCPAALQRQGSLPDGK